MNIFSVILIIMLGFSFIKVKSYKYIFMNVALITVLIETYLELGYFISISSTQVSYRLVTELILFVMSIYVLIRSRCNKANLYKATLLISAVIIGIFNLFINPFDIATGNINVSWDDMLAYGKQFEKIHFTSFVSTEFFQLLMYVIIVLAICTIFSQNDFKVFFLKFAYYTKVLLTIGIIEFILKYIFQSNYYNMLCNALFGVSKASNTSVALRGSGIVLQGLTKEGSHYIYVLFIAIIVLFAEHKLTGSNLKWVYTAIALSVAAMSFSAILFLSGSICMYYVYWIANSNTGEIKKFKGFIFFLIIMSCIVGVYIFATSYLDNLSQSSNNFWSRRIVSVFEEIGLVVSGDWKYQSTSLEWSNRVRLLSTYETLKLVRYRPLFGHGIASITSHGSTTMFLAGTGIIGTYLWVRFSFFQNIQILSGDVKEQGGKYYKLAITIWLFVNLLNSMGLRPFYEVTTFVLMISFRILFLYKKEEYILERG